MKNLNGENGIEKTIYFLSNLSFPVVTDDIKTTNFYFSIFKKFFEEIQFSFPKIETQQVFFLASLQSMKYVDMLKKEEKVNVEKECECSIHFEKIEYYIKSIIKSIEISDLN